MITAKLTIAQPIRVNASGISTRGARGKSTYELYLETTTDNPPMTEEEFVNSKAVLEQTTGQSITHGMSQKAVTDELALKVDKVTGKSLISDAEITRLASVTNQTLSGLGGEPAVNKKTTINPASDIEFPTSKAVATALALKTDDATLQASLKAAYPVIPYRSRVIADSGVINDLEKLTKLYIENLKLLDNTVFLWGSSAGMKTRTSGINTLATKLYDMSAGNRDATQTTEANQPFVGGGIALNEKKRLKNLSTASTKGLAHTQVSFSATDNWSVTTVLKGFENTSSQSTGMYAGDISTGKGLYLYRGGNRMALFDGVNEYSTNDITSFLNSNIGKSMIVTWMYTANAMLLFVNGVQMTTISTFSQFNFVFNVLFQNVSGQRNLAGEIYYHQIFNKALSASEVQAQHAYLRLQHPEIEGINIGNQHWATSNYEGGGTGNGTIIPEVQDNAAWAELTTPAWCYYNNGPTNGAVYGKEYNLYGAQAINANAPAGYTIGTYAQWLQMVTLLGGTPVAGNKMKLNGTALWAIGNVGTNESGFTALPNGQRNADGTFSQINNKANFWTSDGYLVTLDYNAATVTFTSGANAKIGAAVRLLRTSPVGDNERTINTGYITNALGATNLDISIPFGYQVESVRIDSETNITGLSAKLYTGALAELETLFAAKSVTANVQKVIAADADQSIQQTDAVVRINGTKANTASRFRVWVKITKVVFS